MGGHSFGFEYKSLLSDKLQNSSDSDVTVDPVGLLCESESGYEAGGIGVAAKERDSGDADNSLRMALPLMEIVVGKRF